MAHRRLEPLHSNGTDAIVALTADHRRVMTLFKEFWGLKNKSGRDGAAKALLVNKICTELKMHTLIEEEIFYPAVRAQIRDDDLMDEALVEHAGAKKLIEELEGMEPDDELYDAKVTVLGAEINHHAAEEEGDMFPRARKAKIDTAALGEKIAERKRKLKSAWYGSGATAERRTTTLPMP